MRIAVARTPRACEGQAHWSCVPVGFGKGGSVLRLCGFFVVLCVLAGWSVPAAAHPHVWIVARSEVVFDAEGSCCMDQGCGRNDPYPVLGSCDADGLRAPQLQHAVQDRDADVDLGRLTLVRARAQPVPDHALVAPDRGLGQRTAVVAG